MGSLLFSIKIIFCLNFFMLISWLVSIFSFTPPDFGSENVNLFLRTLTFSFGIFWNKASTKYEGTCLAKDSKHSGYFVGDLLFLLFLLLEFLFSLLIVLGISFILSKLSFFDVIKLEFSFLFFIWFIFFCFLSFIIFSASNVVYGWFFRTFCGWKAGIVCWPVTLKLFSNCSNNVWALLFSGSRFKTTHRSSAAFTKFYIVMYHILIIYIKLYYIIYYYYYYYYYNFFILYCIFTFIWM